MHQSWSLFVRDQWRATRRLTVSAGLRYEFAPPGRLLNGTGVARYDPDTDLVLVCGVGKTPINCGTDFHRERGFSPRIGLAWRATETFVVRAGYSIAFEPWPPARGIGGYPSSVIAALVQFNSFQAGTFDGSPANGRATLKDGLPPVPPAPNVSSGVIPLPLNQGLSGWGADFRNGYTQSWNFTLQKQLGKVVAQAGYVASRSIIPYWYDTNGGTLGRGLAGLPLYQKYGRTAGMRVTGANLTNARYDSLQTSLERRFNQGYQVNLAYTWSKAIGAAPTANGWILPGTGLLINSLEYIKLNRSLLPQDIPHNFVASGIAELPFGKGKRWASSGPLAWLAGGWQLNGIFAAYSGTPFSVFADNTSLNDFGANTQRADLVKRDVKILGGIGPTSAYFDPTAFASVTGVRFGTAGFNLLRGPGMLNVDASVFRDFRIRERWRLQFRAEAFNLANQPHFQNPSNTDVSSVVYNPDGSIRDLGGFAAVTGVKATARDGIDERQFRFGLRLSF
jgi:hypothetical protein